MGILYFHGLFAAGRAANDAPALPNKKEEVAEYFGGTPVIGLARSRMPQLPLCVQYLTAFSTPIIALIVAMMALAQWRTAHQRMVVDLFERRMNLIFELSRIVSAILFEGALHPEDADGFLRATRGDKFLFGPEVVEYLQQTYKLLVDLRLCETQLAGAQGEQREKTLEKRLALRSKLEGFHSTFHKLVEPYVAMRQKLRWIDRIVG